MTTRTATWIVHLPGIILEPGVSRVFGPGRIERVEYNRWFDLDGDYNQPVDYHNSDPVFFVGSTISSIDEDAIYRGLQHTVDLVHAALLLATSLLLPHPRHSCTYVRLPGLIQMHIGHGGRDWILCGCHKLIHRLVDAESLDRAATIYALLASTESLWRNTAIEACIQTLTLTAEPDFVTGWDDLNWANQFVSCVAAAEALLLPATPAESTPLATTFGRRVALIASHHDVDRSQYESGCVYMYRLRSKLIHGAGHTGANDDDTTMFYYGRITLCSLALSCLGLARSRGALPDLPALLASIEHDGAEIERLTASIAAGLAPFALFND